MSKSREKIDFAIVYGRVLSKPQNIDLNCREWLMKAGFKEQRCDEAIRGYISENGIQLFRGKDCHKVEVLNGLYLATLCSWYCSKFGHHPAHVYNGLTIVEDGDVVSMAEDVNLGDYILGMPGEVHEVPVNF